MASVLVRRDLFGHCQSCRCAYNLIKMGLVFVINQIGRRSVSAANTACTRLVGVAAFFRQFVWPDIGSVKLALSCPAHQRVTPAVRRLT